MQGVEIEFASNERLDTPPKTNGERTQSHVGLVQIIFLFKGVKIWVLC